MRLNQLPIAVLWKQLVDLTEPPTQQLHAHKSLPPHPEPPMDDLIIVPYPRTCFSKIFFLLIDVQNILCVNIKNSIYNLCGKGEFDEAPTHIMFDFAHCFCSAHS